MEGFRVSAELLEPYSNPCARATNFLCLLQKKYLSLSSLDADSAVLNAQRSGVEISPKLISISSLQIVNCYEICSNDFFQHPSNPYQPVIFVMSL